MIRYGWFFRVFNRPERVLVITQFLHNLWNYFASIESKSTHFRHIFVELAVFCYTSGKNSTPKGSRTPVFGLRTRCPRPLDDGGVADPVDGTGATSPFQAFGPKAPKTSLRIRPRTNSWPANRWKLTSSSKKKTDSKTKGCKCARHCPHSP